MSTLGEVIPINPEFARQRELYEHFSPAEGAKLADYATQITHFDTNLHKHQLIPTRRIFIDAVSDGVNQLFVDATNEEVEFSKQHLTNYGLTLNAARYDRVSGSRNVSFFSWVTCVRRLANFTNGRPNVEIVYAENEGANTRSTQEFWKDIYENTVNDHETEVALFNYTLGAGIENKDPEFLQDVVERMSNESALNVLAISEYDDQKIIRITFDTFNMLLREAGEAGWSNAKVLTSRLEQMAKRDVPLQSLMNALSNQVTAQFNKAGILNNGQKFDDLSLLNVGHVPEAINRCLYLVFEFGKDHPEGHDSLNYQLTGQIIGQLALESNRILHESE